MQGITVRFRENGNGTNAHFTAGADYAQGDFTTVGY
jgi:hypothetical protein